MKSYAEKMEFEKAGLVRKKIEFIENYQARSVIVSDKIGDVDVFSILEENGSSFVNFLMVRNGTIVQTKTLPAETHLDESVAEILSFTIGQLRTILASQAK